MPKRTKKPAAKPTATKKPARAKRPDPSQVALSVVEKAIGGKLAGGKR